MSKFPKKALEKCFDYITEAEVNLSGLREALETEPVWDNNVSKLFLETYEALRYLNQYIVKLPHSKKELECHKKKIKQK